MNLAVYGALLGFVVAVVAACVYIVRRIREDTRQSREFLARLTTVEPDETARTAYEVERTQVFQELKGSTPIDTDRLEDDRAGEPANAWQRLLNDALRTRLKTALMRRAISNFPAIATLPGEIQQKAQMYQRGLISPIQWQSVLKMRDWLQEETLELRHEAECLVEKWGIDGGIFQEAAVFHKHMAKKNQEEALRRRGVPTQ